MNAKNAMMRPHSVPPAMYPLASSTPGLVSASASLAGFPRSLSAASRNIPPMKIGVLDASDRYMPTATGSAETPHSSSVTAMSAPAMMSDHSSVPPRMPWMML